MIFAKSMLGFVLTTVCFLQLTCASHAQVEGELPGVSGAPQGCRIAGSRSGAETWSLDVYIYVSERCWQFFGPAVTGVVQRGTAACGTLRLAQNVNVMGWEYIAGQRPCVEKVPMQLVVSYQGQTYTLNYDYNFNIEPR